MILPITGLQAAYYQILQQDDVLGEWVSGIYDQLPQGAAFPYVVFGRSSSTDWSVKKSRGMQSLITLHVYGAQSKLQVLRILDRIYELLQGSSPNLEGHQLVAIRFEYHDVDRREESGIYQGIIRFRAYTEALVV